MEKPIVLIVDDDDSIRSMYKDAFDIVNVQTLTAQNGDEGLRLALTHHPNAILIDIMMPGMNGHETVNKLRRDPWGKDAKVIYLTNLSDPENVVSAVAQGSEEYIIKSNLSPTEVVRLTRTIMGA